MTYDVIEHIENTMPFQLVKVYWRRPDENESNSENDERIKLQKKTVIFFVRVELLSKIIKSVPLETKRKHYGKALDRLETVIRLNQ